MNKLYVGAQDLLDSDDELPATYDDIDVTATYLNDFRFRNFYFEWVDHQQPWESDTEIADNELNIKYVQEKAKDLQPGEKVLIKKGVLRSTDIYCLRSIEGLTSDATLLWFINFLTFKEIHSSYKRLTSCLVGDPFTKYSKYSSRLDRESKRYRFSIHIK